MPRPSMEMKPSMSAWSRNNAFTPRRLPSSSSPTVPTNITSPTVAMPLALTALINESSAARPRESSPMPGARTVLFLDRNIGPFGKYRVQVRRDHQLRPAAATALAQRDDIAFGIDGCVLEAELLHLLQEIFRPDLLFERGRRNFSDALLFVQSRRIVLLSDRRG